MTKSFKKIICLLLALSLFACTSKEELEGATDIANLLGAENVTISKGFESSTEKETIDYIGIEILNPHVLIDSSLSAKAVANLSALTLYRKLTEEVKKEKNAIKVELKVTTKNGEQEFKQVILFTDLIKAERAIKRVEKFSQYIRDGKYETAYTMCGIEITASQLKDTTLQLMKELATNNGKITKIQVTDFGPHEVTYEGKELKLIAVEGYYEKSKYINRFSYYVDKEDKIVGFNF